MKGGFEAAVFDEKKSFIMNRFCESNGLLRLIELMKVTKINACA